MIDSNKNKLNKINNKKRKEENEKLDNDKVYDPLFKEILDELIKISSDPEFIKQYNLEMKHKRDGYYWGFHDGVDKTKETIAMGMLKDDIDKEFINKYVDVVIELNEDDY